MEAQIFDESARLESLRDYDVLDTADEQSFDDIALLASQICQTPIALISLVDDNRQWFKSRIGLEATETPRDVSFCAHALHQSELFVVADASQDAAFALNPLVTGDPHIRFYAGMPLQTEDGHTLGTLCVIDRTPRELTDAQRKALEALSRQVMSQLELRRNGVRLEKSNAALNREIAERKCIEDELRESEARYRVVTDSASDGIITIDRKQKILFANESASRIFGYEVDELIGQQMPMLMPDNLCQAHVAGMKRHVETGKRHISWQAVELPGLHRNGRQIPLEISFGQHTMSNGERIFTGIIRDITERKRAEEAVRKSEEYHNLFRLANDPILIFRPEDEIVLDVNDKACEVYGYTREEFINRSLKGLSGDVERGNRQLEVLLAEKAYQAFETTQFHRDGTPIHFLINSSIIEYNGQQAVLSINRDITGRLAAEEALQKSEAQLRQAQKMESIGTLAGGIAHDFNNLLSVILGNTQLALRNRELDARIAGRIGAVEQAAGRAATLTRQLLAFSRRQQLERKNINLDVCIADVMKMVERIIGADITIRIHQTGNLSPVFADSAQIEQVVMNMAVNARDAMPEGGTLVLETHHVALDEDYCRRHIYAKPGSYVRLMISDTGIGMDKETQARIFEPFFTTKEVGKGTGLGLATVYGIVKQHDGFIEVYSEQNHGTTFKIYLPAVASARVGRTGNEILINAVGGAETILIAEDEDALRELTCEVLEELGYTVLAARNGAEAIEIFRDNQARISLVMLDVVMPVIGGHEAYRHIRDISADMPIMYMTGYSAEMHAGVETQTPAVMTIQKPYQIGTLGDKVRAAIDGV